MFDPKSIALLFAIMHVLIREKPELRDEILRMADEYQKTYFIPHAEAYPCMRAALDDVLGS